MNKPHIIVEGMAGLGDNIHQRAVVASLMVGYVVWLRTPWPSLYHDLVGDDLKLLRKTTTLRTQARNQSLSAHQYTAEKPPIGCDVIRIWYSHDGVRRKGSFLGAMAHESCAQIDVHPRSFALPVPDGWLAKAQRLVDAWAPTKPIMIYRPLVERKEWDGNRPRNPEPTAYVDLAASIAANFFVVAVADLVANVEWAVSPPFKADVALTHGELDFETMAGLFALAGLVFTAPGFALILAQAVNTPLVAVFGGHESARFYDFKLPKQHFIQPIMPCECFSKNHDCEKTIPFYARAKLQHFVTTLLTSSTTEGE